MVQVKVDYLKSFQGHVDTTHQVRGLHRRAGDFLNVSEPPVQTIVQLDELEDTIVLNGSPALRRGDSVRLYGLTRVQLNNHGIKDYLIPTLGYEILDPHGRIIHSFDRTRSQEN
jgi:hypothetical protein